MSNLRKIQKLGPVSLIKRMVLLILQIPRKLLYHFLSDIKGISNKGYFRQPVLLTGQGKIIIGKSKIGYWLSPYFLSGYSYFEARNTEAKIIIGNNVLINNSATIIADRSSITIGNNCLIGPEFCAFDSDFHGIEADKRNTGDHKSKAIQIGDNVFIGNRVTVLKGVKIGNNSVIGSGSIVVKDIPENSIASGNPAVFIKNI